MKQEIETRLKITYQDKMRPHELVRRVGTKQDAITCLEKWFVGNRGSSMAYDFFVQKIGLWPWKPIVWKSSILPKHCFILWLFSHGKMLMRDRQPYVENKTCGMCNSGDESAAIFSSCVRFREIYGMN